MWKCHNGQLLNINGKVLQFESTADDKWIPSSKENQDLLKSTKVSLVDNKLAFQIHEGVGDVGVISFQIRDILYYWEPGTGIYPVQSSLSATDPGDDPRSKIVLDYPGK